MAAAGDRRSRGAPSPAGNCGPGVDDVGAGEDAGAGGGRDGNPAAPLHEDRQRDRRLAAPGGAGPPGQRRTRAGADGDLAGSAYGRATLDDGAVPRARRRLPGVGERLRLAHRTRLVPQPAAGRARRGSRSAPGASTCVRRCSPAPERDRVWRDVVLARVAGGREVRAQGRADDPGGPAATGRGQRPGVTSSMRGPWAGSGRGS